MGKFKLAMITLLAGGVALASSPLAARSGASAGSWASGGGVVVRGGRLPGIAVGKPRFRQPSTGWWNGGMNQANGSIFFGHGDWRERGHWKGHGGGHLGDHHGGKHHHGHDRGDRVDDDVFFGDYWGYDEDGDGYVETIPMADQFGFFATGGQVMQRAGARPTYNYDRGYPYDWFNGAPGGAAALANAPYARPGGMSCGLEAGIKVCRGW